MTSTPTTTFDPLTSTPELRSVLLRAAAARTTQLLELPVPSGRSAPVAEAHRASVRRILAEIHAALDRMDAGTYGACLGCGSRLAAARLAERPWVSDCERCVARVL